MVQVLHAQNTDSVVVTTETTRLTIPNTSLIASDRYLVLYKALVGVTTGHTVIRIKYGPSVQTAIGGVAVTGSPSPQLKQVSGMDVYTAIAGQDVTLTAEGSFSTFSGDEQLLMINLDDGLVEGVDWDANRINLINASIQTTFGIESIFTELTFSPDGVSDYLLIGHFKFESGHSSKGFAFRVQDRTNVITIAQEGYGTRSTGPTGVDDEHSYAIFGVLSAPTAGARTIRTEFRGSSSPQVSTRRGSIFMLRLNAFKSHGFFSTDLNAAPTGARQSVGSFSFTPTAGGEVVLLGDFKSEATPGFESGHGLIGDIEYGGSIVADMVDAGLHIAPSDNSFVGKGDTHVGPSFNRLLTGQAGAATVEGFVDSSPSIADLTLRRMTLVAFSTELVNPVQMDGGIDGQSSIPSADMQTAPLVQMDGTVDGVSIIGGGTLSTIQMQGAIAGISTLTADLFSPIENNGFEIAGVEPGEAEAWLVVEKAGVEEYAEFQGTLLSFPFDGFEQAWSNDDFLLSFDPSDLETANFDQAILLEPVEDFEEGWDANEGWSDVLVSTDTALFDTTTPEAFEDFEEEWDQNEDWQQRYGNDIIEVRNASVGEYRIDLIGQSFIHDAQIGDTINDIAAALDALIDAASLPLTATLTANRIELVADDQRTQFGLVVTGPTAGDIVITASLAEFGVMPSVFNTGLDQFEAFEREWKDNENFVFAFVGPPTDLTFAVFDVAEDQFEDFEDEWPTVVMQTI